MISLVLEFHGTPQDYEYDINEKTNTIMFHDIKKNIIIMGEVEEAQMQCDAPDTVHDSRGNYYQCGIASCNGTIKFKAYSFFKYNNNNQQERFKIYWNERETVIWDTEEKKQVINKNIYQYLQKLNNEEDEYEDEYYDW